MPTDDLSVDQANDLAKHLLGPEWTAFKGMDIHGGPLAVQDRQNAFSHRRLPFRGKSWREAIEAAGGEWPQERGEGSCFAAHESRVMLGTRHICTAVSNNFAKRISNALNHYVPNRKGV